MTVSYTADVANGSSFGCFWKILGRWRGSVYKLIWRELIAYLLLYCCINASYRNFMSPEQRKTFEKIKVYCSKQIESIPMSFVLGFYVSLVVKRWWDQYWILPRPDSLALYISASIHGHDERGRIFRRTIMRYTMLAYIITLQRISVGVKKRFPTLQHLVDAGLMEENEKKIFDMMEEKTKVIKFWMPVVWASNLINRARQEGRIISDHMVQTVITEMSDFRRKLGRILVYDNVSVPLVYTQVVTLAVYTYFAAALIGKQWVSPKKLLAHNTAYPGFELDLYFPIFLSLQFVFYVGWLKVAETLINPFGEDDDDFELNWLIDRHIKVSYMVVDEMHEEHPELLKDHYWEQKVPQELPYNMASEHYRQTEPQGSTAGLKIKSNESIYADLNSAKRNSTVPDDVYAEYASVSDSPLINRGKSWLNRQLSRVESFRSTSSTSSFFNRNRNPSQVNGSLSTNFPHNPGRRLSIYDRILNRRSSKQMRRLPSISNGKLPGKDSLMPNLHSRPRVPTPDVSKDQGQNNSTGGQHQEKPNGQIGPLLEPSTVQISTSSLKTPANIIKSNHQLETSRNANSSRIFNIVSIPTTPPRNSEVPPIRQDYSIIPVSNTSNIGKQGRNELVVPVLGADGVPPRSMVSASNPILVNNNGRLAVVLLNDPQRITSDGQYDFQENGSTTSSNAGANVLTTIEENDSSPYSTSSTTRSCRSSNYPSTSSIFGRKMTPPPIEEGSQFSKLFGTPGSSNSSLKSENGGNGGISQLCLEDSNTSSQKPCSSRADQGYSLDNSDEEDARPYMTIDELSESKSALQNKLKAKVDNNSKVEMQTQTSIGLNKQNNMEQQPMTQQVLHSSSFPRQNAIYNDDESEGHVTPSLAGSQSNLNMTSPDVSHDVHSQSTLPHLLDQTSRDRDEIIGVIIHQPSQNAPERQHPSTPVGSDSLAITSENSHIHAGGTGKTFIHNEKPIPHFSMGTMGNNDSSIINNSLNLGNLIPGNNINGGKLDNNKQVVVYNKFANTNSITNNITNNDNNNLNNSNLSSDSNVVHVNVQGSNNKNSHSNDKHQSKNSNAHKEDQNDRGNDSGVDNVSNDTSDMEEKKATGKENGKDVGKDCEVFV